jgi:putative endonuclease
MYYIYIIYSKTSDKFYIGYSDNPQRRVVEHNTKPFNTYTSKHRPWIIKAIFQCSLIEAEAIRIEKFIKKQKSRELIEKLADSNYIPTGYLAQLIRVPDVRD